MPYLQCRDENVSLPSLCVCLACFDVQVVCLSTRRQPAQCKFSLSWDLCVQLREMWRVLIMIRPDMVFPEGIPWMFWRELQKWGHCCRIGFRSVSCFEAPHTQTPPKPVSPWILQDAYSEIAYLFAEFFRDLDIVPSDIIAGLVLLRQRQRAKRNAVLDEVGRGGVLLRSEVVGISPGLWLNLLLLWLAVWELHVSAHLVSVVWGALASHWAVKQKFCSLAAFSKTPKRAQMTLS